MKYSTSTGHSSLKGMSFTTLPGQDKIRAASLCHTWCHNRTRQGDMLHIEDRGSTDRERFARSVQESLRGEERNYRLWGLAIDQALAAREQGATAGTFIVLTVVAALGVVGLALRSYWATALTSVGIGALMIWLKGLSALVGIKGGLVVELIVPIAMVSLEDHHPDSVAEFDRIVRERPEILECHATSGQHDYTLKVVCASIQAYDQLLSRWIMPCKAVHTVNTSFVLRSSKCTTALPL